MATRDEMSSTRINSGDPRHDHRLDIPTFHETGPYKGSPRTAGVSSEKHLSAGDVIKIEAIPSSLDEIKQLSEQLERFFKKADGVLRASPPDLDHIIQCYAALPTMLRTFLGMVAGLPAPGPDRDALIGEAFIGIASAQWAKLGKNDPRSWFASVVGAYKPTEEQMESWIEPTWLKTPKALVDFKVDATKMPATEYYLSLSPMMIGRLREADQAITEAFERYESLKNGNAACIAKGREPQFPAAEEGARVKYESAIGQKIDLLPRTSDVFPTQLTEALSRITVSVIPKESVVRDLVRMAASLETVLVAALIARKKAPAQVISLACPRLKSSGEIAPVAVQVPSEQLSELGRDDERLAVLVKAITSFRELIGECITLVPDMPEPVRKYLAAPLSTVSGKWVDALVRLMSSESAELRGAVAELIGKPVVSNPTRSSWGYVLEVPQNYSLTSTLIARYLGSAEGDERRSYRVGLETAPSMNHGALGLMDTIQGHLDHQRFGRLAKFLNEQIVGLARDGDTTTCLALLGSLDFLVGDNAIRTSLRHQLPNLEDVKKVGEKLSEKHEDLAEQISQIVGRIVKGLSQSLEDYYMEGNGGELREAIENYRYFLTHRDCLQGAPANEAIRSAIIVYGPPGVGKSFFVNCLKNDFNVELFALSPSAKDEGEDRLDYTKKVIERVKKYGKPCILLVDEAEATAVDRRIPTITSEDRAVTNYLLTEMDELRRDHPHIFVVFATNYIKQVDPAIRRPGRADLPYEMSPPGDAGRAALIRGAIIQHAIDLELEDDEIAELVQLSDGFTPGRIKLAILETHRVTIPRRRVTNPDVEFSYEILREAFKAEQARLQRDNALGQTGDLV